MTWAHFIRETWDDMPVAIDGEVPAGPTRVPFGGGQWLVVAMPSVADAVSEAVRDARAMGVRVTALIFRDDQELDLILGSLPDGDSLVPAGLDDGSANQWAMEAAELLKHEPQVRQVLLAGKSLSMSQALEREFPLASQYRVGGEEAMDVAEVLAILLHTPRCC